MKLRPFELALLIFFGVLGIVALFLLSNYDPPQEETDAVLLSRPVMIWGTLDPATFNSVLSVIKEANEQFKNVTYEQIDERNFDFELINAIAERRNPDIVLISHERLIEHRTKFYPIPYEIYPVRDFRNTFIDGAQVYTLKDGLYGFPIMIDPLVMYWNRDLFASVGFINPPTSWEEVVGETTPAIVQRDFNRAILRSPIAFGTYENITHPFAILSMLLLQSGSSLVTEDDTGYRVGLNIGLDEQTPNPFTDALSFYTKFGSISNPLYSWNRTLPNDLQMFTAEDLGLYFGYGSESREIEELNPNLNFDIAEVPNGETATVRRTYGRFYSFGILKESQSINEAFVVAQYLTSPNYALRFAEAYNMAPAHRSTLTTGSNDVYGRVIYRAAQVSRAWLNPDLDQVDPILRESIGDIHANRRNVSSAVSDVNTRLGQIYRDN